MIFLCQAVCEGDFVRTPPRPVPSVAINFVILAFVIFMMIKQINRMKREEPAAAPAPAAPAEDVVLLREIRDALKQK